jgi:hypothetical protein
MLRTLRPEASTISRLATVAFGPAKTRLVLPENGFGTA